MAPNDTLSGRKPDTALMHKKYSTDLAQMELMIITLTFDDKCESPPSKSDWIGAEILRKKACKCNLKCRNSKQKSRP